MTELAGNGGNPAWGIGQLGLPSAPAPDRLPPMLFLALVALLLALLAAGRPKESFLGLAIVACGLPVYALVFREPRKESP